MTTNKSTTTQDAKKTSPPAVKRAVLFRTDAPLVTFRQRFEHSEANLLFLDCGEYHLPPGSRSLQLAAPGRECLLFMWKGSATVELGGASYDLAPYDTLYVPLGAAYQLANATDAPACIIQTSAPAKNVHPVFHSKFAEFSHREDRIRHLQGKIVYLMFDVSEGADKLVAGYTFYDPYTRAWPPHNHTDQEETYIFIKGHGAMEVYPTPEENTFVHSVNEGDLVTIPFLNYHPVFSQEDPLQFIWCIAGERYWVGDKNKDFMKGSGPAITT
jgi:mannose-6-phosphate isomerase-like protein (cupin superfamily)